MNQSPENLAVIGAGNMGNAIASLFAQNGWRVVLIDPSDDALRRSKDRLLQGLPVGSELADLLTWRPSLDAASAATLVIEAAPEQLALKQRLFLQLEAVCDPHAVFATNTSGLSISALAEPLTHPERFVGTHFFTPADVIPLVEVVGGRKTAPDTVDRVMTVLRKVGKLPVHVRQDIPGFIANRLQHALAREAMSLLEQGVASAEDIDTVAKWSLGVRLAITGPLEQRDLNGLDIHHAIAEYLYPQLESRQTPPTVLAEKVAHGHLGEKTGQGFYAWDTPEKREALTRKEAALRSLIKHLESL